MHVLRFLLKSLFHVHLSSGTHCSHVPPKDLVSDGNTLHISFSSNDKVVDTGFTATWRAVDPTDGKRGEKCAWQDTGRKALRQNWCLSCFSFLPFSPFPLPSLFYTHMHTNTAPCGGRFSSAQGEITSPNWPSDYQAQSVCTWRITIPSAKSVHVAFTHFELQAVNMFGNCIDYVEVFNGDSMASLGRLL